MSDVKSCLDEAQAAVREVAFAVSSIEMSSALPAGGSEAFLNIVTLEGRRMCVRIGEEGFRVVSDQPDCQDTPAPACYETVYALLSDLSEGFRSAFSGALSARLLDLTAAADADKN
ncbi:hypothetical protein BOX15_Mlig007812g1 [Macrostomum lignano]|uniref:GSKIP domain-containing protein n=1 Tax=Macrostomum lignano TaxID=282301 RepID=A0A267E1X1_9PLAT|nr:hypothetical protein BOX15_Mlig007812g1 [Macrostomum lignano]